MQERKLEHLYIGKTDAKHEILNQKHVQRFKDTFLVPPNTSISKILDSQEIFFVSGYKGSGKTALLRYLSIVAKERDWHTHFILFKSDITTQMKKTLGKLNITRDETESDDDPQPSVSNVYHENDIFNRSNKDFEAAWTWFFIDRIFHLVKQDRLSLFQYSTELSDIQKILSNVEYDPKTLKKGVNLPKLTHGNISLSLNLKEIVKADLSADIEFPQEQKSIALSVISEILVTLVKRLEAGTDRLVIFVDELEILPDIKKIQDRDIYLIRDLIVTSYKLNMIFQELEIPILIVTSVRTEVANHPKMKGKEINKYIKDFGTNLMWHRFERDDLIKHPLIQLIIRRVTLNGDRNELDDQEERSVWRDWFPDDIQGQINKSYILYQTWYRPRDIIRLLLLAVDQFPNSHAFTQKVFDGIRKDYSKECWEEIAEELSSIHGYEEIQFIVDILTGFKRVFTLFEFERRFQEFTESRTVAFASFKEFAELLYRVGIIGNMYYEGSRVRHRWRFRGDNDLITTNEKYNIAVHQALHAAFSITS